MFEWLLPLIPALPLAAAVWLVVRLLFGIGSGESGERHTARVVTGVAAVNVVLVLLANVLFLANGAQVSTRVCGNWLLSGDYVASISFTADTLSLSMALLVAVILPGVPSVIVRLPASVPPLGQL